MKKDRFGICIPFYAVLAFVLAMLGQTLLGGLLLGFVIVVEKDEWLTRQTMQAFFLSLVSGVVQVIVGVISWSYRIPLVGSVISTIFGFVTSIISLILLIFAIIGLVNVIKGKDAGIPGLKALAEKAFGLVKTYSYTSAYTPSQDTQNNQNSQDTDKPQE
jgi:hypothetical protein